VIGHEDSSNRKKRIALKAAPIPLIFAAIVILSFVAFSSRAKVNEKTLCSGIAFHAAEEISDSVKLTINAGMRLHDVLETNSSLEKGYIRAISEGILNSAPFIVGVSTAPSAIVKYHFPEGGNETLIGHDLLSNPERRDSLTRAAELKTPVVSGPFEAVDGGNFLFIRYPVFSEGKLWGFTSLTIDFQKMLDAFGLETHYPGLRFAISETEVASSAAVQEKVQGSRFLGGTEAAYYKGGVSQKISLPGAEWRVHVMPSRDWTLADPYLYILFIAGLMVSVLLFIFFYSRIRNRVPESEGKGNWLETSVKAAKERLSAATQSPAAQSPATSSLSTPSRIEPIMPTAEVNEAVAVDTVREFSEGKNRNQNEEKNIGESIVAEQAPEERSPEKTEQEPAIGSLFPELAIIAKNGGRKLRFKGPAVKGELYMPEAPAPTPTPADATALTHIEAQAATLPFSATQSHIILDEGSPSPRKQEFLFSLEDESARGECSILVVDDSDANRDIMGRMLSLRGYKADFAGSGEEAISLCADRRYDIIFMDCFMPGMDGYKTCITLREKHPDWGSKIIGMSARIGEQELQRCTLAGMDELLAKPFTMKQMLTRLEKKSNPDAHGDQSQQQQSRQP